MKTSFVIVLFLILSGGVLARDLTMTEAMQLATKHSIALKRAVEQRNALEASYRATQADRFPILSATASAIYKSEVAAFSIGGAGTPLVERELGTKENYQTDVRLSVPIFTGGRLDGSIKGADASRDLAKANEKQVLEAAAYQARVEFLNLIKADRLIDAAGASLKRATIMQEDIVVRMSAGTADSVDLLDTRLSLTNAELALKRAHTNRRTVELRLSTMLGLPPVESITARESLITPDIGTVQQMDVADTKPELLAAAAQLNQSRSQIIVARSELFPTISVYAGYSYGKPNIDLFNKTWNDYYTIGASLSWSLNLGNKTVKNTRRSQYFYRAFSYERDNIAEQLGREAAISWENLSLAYERYKTASDNARTASINFRLASERHREGILTSNRLLDVETALTAAEADEAAAVVEYYIALSGYYYNVGSDKIIEGIQ